MIILVLIIISVLLYNLFLLVKPKVLEKRRIHIMEFDLKYKPVCDSLGGIYKQEGNYRNNICYLNDSGILRKGYMNKINGEWHLTDV